MHDNLLHTYKNSINFDVHTQKFMHSCMSYVYVLTCICGVSVSKSVLQCVFNMKNMHVKEFVTYVRANISV